MQSCKQKNPLWFSILELILAITIMSMLITLTYIPYKYYNDKAILKQWSKLISQSLYEARNLAVNGYKETNNRSIWLYFESGEINTLKFFSYPFSNDENTALIKAIEWNDINLIKKIDLPEWLQISWINNEAKFLFYFTAIKWKWKYLYWDNLLNDTPPSEDYGQTIEIITWLKWATTWILTKKITYYTETNIVDY